MNKKKLAKIFAVSLACIGISVFAFSGCQVEDENGGNQNGTEMNGDNSGNTGGDSSGGNSGGSQGGNQGGSTGGNEGDNQGGSSGGNEGGSTLPDVDPPVIPTVPKENVQITEAKGDLEAGYLKWKACDGAEWYNVYVKAENGDYKKLDDALVRQYKDYYRADAVGLKAGKYTMKVVPTATGGGESENLSATAEFSVIAHDRSGFGFVNGTSSGAYNEDGTLKDNATVIYITENTKNTVSLNVTGATSNPCVGLQNILGNYKKETRPLAVRLIGNVTDMSVLEKGDVLIDGAKAGVTFEGIGDDATCNGWGLRIKGASNVEVRNLAFMNCDSSEGDDVGLQQDNDHIWVHNCDFFYGHAGSDKDQVKGDGALDTKKSTYVTHSYNHFWDNGKCNLQGMKSETTENYITYHHNWYDHSDSRHPRIRTCTVHIYNNYFDGNAKYGVGVTMGASAFVESNYFRSTAEMKPMLSSNQGTDAKGEGTFSGEAGGIIKAYDNKFEGSYDLMTQKNTADLTDLDCYLAEARDERVPDEVKTKSGGTGYNNFDTASNMYKYEVSSPEAAKNDVTKWAGRINGGDFKWVFDNDTEDANYAVIQPLKDKLMAYSGSGLLKIGDIPVTGGPSDGGNEGGGETGGETGGNEGGTLPEGTIKIEFGKDAQYPSGITVVGNYNSAGALKMESSTKITLKVERDTSVTVHADAGSRKIKFQINGGDTVTQTLDGGGEVSVALKAGDTLIITKGETVNLQYLLFS